MVNRRRLCSHPRLARVRAPFLHRRYPASTVLRTHPPSATAGAVPRGRVVELRHSGCSRRQTSLVAHCSSPCVLPPLPRWDRRVRPSLSSPRTAAFPVIMAGRLPHWLFRGLLGVHSRYGPHGPLTPFVGPFLEVLQAIRHLLTRPECFRLERELAGPDLNRGKQCTLARHT